MKKVIYLVKAVLAALIVLSSVQAYSKVALSSSEIPYYGEQFYQNLSSGAQDQDLIDVIKLVLKSLHSPRAGSLDQILSDCGGRNSCYSHSAVGYNRARQFLLGNFYLVPESNGKYGVREVYCQQTYPSSKFSKSKPGPSVIPDDKVVNLEHTWPQSRFNRKYNKEYQKSDMHHLFPSDSHVNAVRGNFEFGEVITDKVTIGCGSGARFGARAGGVYVFEPPQVHKGNVARALFYFSLRYDMPISPAEEAVLRKWNIEDPVDEEEAVRNQKIFELQKIRNPFIDFPNLSDNISDF